MFSNEQIKNFKPKIYTHQNVRSSVMVNYIQQRVFLPQRFNGNRLTETKAGKIPVKDTELLILKDFRNR